MSLFRLIPLCLALLCLSACATVNRGVTEHFRIDSVPQGAKVTLTTDNIEIEKSQKQSGPIYQPRTIICPKTPCAIPLARSRSFVAKVELEGYEPFETFVSSGFSSGAAAGNAALTTATSLSGGAATGAFAATVFAPVLSSFFVPFSQEAARTVSSQVTSSVISTGATAGLGVGIGLVAIDFGSGSNLNLSPNPVVVGLAQTGQTVIKDPMVPLFRRKINDEIRVTQFCKVKSVKLRQKYEAECKLAENDLRESSKKFRETRKEIADARKAFRKQLREEEAAAAAVKIPAAE